MLLRLGDDPIAFDLFLKRIANEPVDIVRSAIVFRLYHFMDALSPQQRENCRMALQEQTKRDDGGGGSYFAVMLMLADHFPQDAELIKSCLKKNSRLLMEEQSEMVLETLDKKR